METSSQKKQNSVSLCIDRQNKDSLVVAVVAVGQVSGVRDGRRTPNLSITVKLLPSITPKRWSHAKIRAALAMGDQGTGLR